MGSVDLSHGTLESDEGVPGVRAEGLSNRLESPRAHRQVGERSLYSRARFPWYLALV